MAEESGGQLSSDRTTGGRFAPGNKAAVGNKGGPGRPRRELEERYLERFNTICSEEDWDAIIRKAVTQAKEGNWRAREFVANYKVGKPPVRVEAEITPSVAPFAALPSPDGESDLEEGTILELPQPTDTNAAGMMHIIEAVVEDVDA